MSNKENENETNKKYLRQVIDNCHDAVDQSKFGPMRGPDGPEGQKQFDSVAYQVFITLLQSVAPKYSYTEIVNLEPLEPWQTPPPEEPEAEIGSGD